MKNFIYLIILFPLLYSCQKYNKPPFDEKEKAIRSLPVSMKILVLDSLWDKRDSLSYLRLEQINKLLIKNNKNAPNWIGNFSNLRSIDISNSNHNFVYIPETIGKLQKLEIFDASENSINKIPNQLYSIKSLKVLDLDNNSLSELSENISSLSNLESLSLRSNNISYLPKSICQLSKLESFVLENTKIKELPKCLGKLPNIEWINISGTLLTKFPVEILQAPKLKTVHAKGLKLNNYKELKEICKQRNITFYYDEK